MGEIFYTFFRIGLVGFGGPIALISLIEQEVCQNKKWVTTEKFAEIFSICKLLPGPFAVQVAICCGYQKSGRIGGFVAGVAFLLPALVLIILLGFLYVHGLNTKSTHLRLVFEYMQDATLAVILITVFALGKLYIKSITSIVILLSSIIFVWLHPSFEPIVIVAFGLLGILWSYRSKLSNKASNLPAIFTTPSFVHDLSLSVIFYSDKLFKIFWICIKAGEFSFGTGLAIIPLLHADLVTNFHWLTEQQFLDGITLGQITPGPSTVSIVFFGFVIAGIPGLLISLIGFYLPPMFNSLVLIPLFWQKMAKSNNLKIFTNWAFPAVIGGILSATIKLGIVAVNSYIDVILVLLSLFILYKKLLPVWALIPLCGATGFIASYIY
ncbi:MAG: chromate efflux transporter [Neisseriaceae bacterium]|nr:MAG: chromate efflux transporter [Neisseriaceae bacterium]